jgi:hypothetical protein
VKSNRFGKCAEYFCGMEQTDKLGFVGDAPRGTFGKVPLGTPQNFLEKSFELVGDIVYRQR